MKPSLPRILLVEDEETAAEVLGTLLELEGFAVTLAPNGKRAIEMLAEVNPQLIITDYMMPVMDGVEMARTVRTMREYAAVPILMTTGVAEVALKDHAAFISGYLRKPFHLEALLDTISRLTVTASKQTTST